MRWILFQAAVLPLPFGQGTKYGLFADAIVTRLGECAGYIVKLCHSTSKQISFSKRSEKIRLMHEMYIVLTSRVAGD
jgi:hypothetical protein